MQVCVSQKVWPRVVSCYYFYGRTGDAIPWETVPENKPGGAQLGIHPETVNRPRLEACLGLGWMPANSFYCYFETRADAWAPHMPFSLRHRETFSLRDELPCVGTPAPAYAAERLGK